MVCDLAQALVRSLLIHFASQENVLQFLPDVIGRISDIFINKKVVDHMNTERAQNIVHAPTNLAVDEHTIQGYVFGIT